MVTLSEDVQRLIQAEMAQGHYASESELVQQALAALREHRLADEAIREAFEDIAAGRLQSAEEFDRDFR